MKSQDFYALFRKHFNPKNNKKVAWAYPGNGKVISITEFTGVIDDVIFRMSKEAGYVHNQESKINDGRVDHHWQKGKDNVFIEHENDFGSVKKEVRNLLNSDGSLRVLITEETNKVKRDKLREYILEELRAKKSGRNFEFLLILGTETDMDDYDAWEAYTYRPSFEEQELPRMSMKNEDD